MVVYFLRHFLYFDIVRIEGKTIIIARPYLFVEK
jgi:hypothetical protein